MQSDRSSSSNSYWGGTGRNGKEGGERGKEEERETAELPIRSPSWGEEEGERG